MIASVPGERITFIGSVPAIYSLILRRPEFATMDVSAVRWVGYGGAPIAPALARALQHAFPAARASTATG
ncbi:MAG TPA: AMP-binding protein [Streptosporangiaceae bacterium]|nr:AMP-binding protein [Streptosporangiaceae bacterium]